MNRHKTSLYVCVDLVMYSIIFYVFSVVITILFTCVYANRACVYLFLSQIMPERYNIKMTAPLHVALRFIVRKPAQPSKEIYSMRKTFTKALPALVA